MEFPSKFFLYPVEIPLFFVLPPWNFMLLGVNPICNFHLSFLIPCGNSTISKRVGGKKSIFVIIIYKEFVQNKVLTIKNSK